MKILKVVVPLLVIALFSAFCANPESEKETLTRAAEPVADNNKHALVIAVGAYDREETGWGSISSQNDVPLVVESLKLQGFAEENITFLRDREADKPGILGALDDLVKRVGKGDMVVVHYSGHGQQIFDDNGDELDGFDESLVAIDAPARYHKIPGYTGQKHIRDEEFGAKITALRQKVGKDGHVLVIMDSCHSGTGTRGGFSKARGGMPPLAPDGYDPAKKKEEGSGLNEGGSTRGDESALGHFVLFAGARFDELNYETTDDNGNDVGSLSYSISKAMTQVEADETYRSLFAKVLAIMAEVAPNQSPMIEGDIDSGLFGGDVKAQTPFYSIKQINATTELIIDGGTIHGLTAGSKVGAYQLGTKDPFEETDKKIAEGTVTSVSNFSATVVFEEELSLKNERSAWIFVLERSLEDMKLTVDVTELDDETRKAIEESLKDVKIVKLNGPKPDVKVLLAGKTESPANRGAAGTGLILRGTDIDIPAREDEVQKVIEQYARGMFLKRVEYWDDMYLVDFEFIPVEMKRTPNGYEEVRRMDIGDYMVDGIPEFPEGTQLKIKVINKGMANAYFNIIDITPQGELAPVAPNEREGLPAEVCMVEAGEEKEIPNYFITIYPPFGMETFKVFATKEPINLEPILRSSGTRGTKGRGAAEFEGMELMMADAFGTRGAGGSSTSSAEGSIFNKNFRIVEK